LLRYSSDEQSLSKRRTFIKKAAEANGALNANDKTTKARLSKLSGGEQFDRAYMNDMVTDHTKDGAEFRPESTKRKKSPT
jgi:predicted outer membrane protein